MTTRRKPRAKRGRSWKAAGTVVPIIISIAALVVSGLSYWDQHQSSEAAATAQQESEARLVAPIWDDEASTLTVQNLSTTEISFIDEVFAIDVITGHSHGDFALLTTINFDISSPLPPCSSLTTNEDSKHLQNILQKAIFVSSGIPGKPESVANLEKKAISYQTSPEFITFNDAKGNNWTENPEGGQLSKIDYQTEEKGTISTVEFGNYGTIKPNNCQ